MECSRCDGIFLEDIWIRLIRLFFFLLFVVFGMPFTRLKDSERSREKKPQDLKNKEAEEKNLKPRTSHSRTKIKKKSASMSKLSPSLKALINAPFARPGQAPAPQNIRDVYTRIAREARKHRYGDRPWVTLSVCLNQPSKGE